MIIKTLFVKEDAFWLIKFNLTIKKEKLKWP